MTANGNHTLKFDWETYNAINTDRFDPISIGSGLTSGNPGIADRLLQHAAADGVRVAV